MLTVEELFTPASPSQGLTFSPRVELDQLKAYYREPGSQLLIYGETGVGKTSLVINSLAGENWVRYQCDSSSTFESITKYFARELCGESASVEERGGSFTSSLRFGGNATGASLEDGSYVKRIFTGQDSFRAQDFIRSVMPEAWKLVVDDFERIKDAATRAQIAQLAKSFSDQAQLVDLGDRKSCAKMVIVGIAETMPELLSGDESTLGRIMSMKLRNLSDEQIRLILRAGFEYLGIRVVPSAYEAFVLLSAGYPRYAHALALEAGRVSIGNGSMLVDDETAKRALKQTLQRYEANYGGLLAKATRSRSGSKQIHLKVLRAIANIRTVNCSIDDIIAKVREYDSTLGVKNIRGPLGELAKTERGAVLRRHHNQLGNYKFSDALFKSYVRMVYYDIQQDTEDSQ